MRITAQAAVESKPPGEADFRVLSWSEGPFAPEQFADVFRQFRAGTLDNRSLHAHSAIGLANSADIKGDDPPWLVFAGATPRNTGCPYLFSIRQERIDQLDSSFQPIPLSRCVGLPFDRIASGGASYTDIADQLLLGSPFANWSPNSAPPNASLLLDGPETFVRRTTAFIDQLGFEYCASLAALTIVTPLAIVSADRLSLKHRVHALDAIAGLLPYGARAGLATATWLQSGIVHKMRIAFTWARTPGQARIVWGETPVKEREEEPLAEEYFQSLITLGTHLGTRGVVEQLMAIQYPLTFADPALFLQYLGEIEAPFRTIRDIRARTASASDARSLLLVLEDSPGNHLPISAKELWSYLIDHADLSELDVKAVARNWDDGLLTQVIQRVVLMIHSRYSDESKLLPFWNLAKAMHFLGDLVSALLDEVKAAVDKPSAEAMATKAFYLLGTFTPADIGGDATDLSRAVGQDRLLLACFLDMVVYRWKADQEFDLCSWLLWLGDGEPSLDNAVRCFSIVTGLAAGTLAEKEIRLLADLDWDLLATLIDADAARSNGQVLSERAVPAIAAWITTTFPSQAALALEPKSQALVDKILSFDFVTTTAKLQAAHDALALLARSQPGTSGCLFLGEQVLKRPVEFQLYEAELVPLLPGLEGARGSLIEKLIDEIALVDLIRGFAATNICHLLYSVVTQHALPATAPTLTRSILEFATQIFMGGSKQISRDWEELFNANGFAAYVNKVQLNARIAPGMLPAEVAQVGAELIRNQRASLPEVIDLIRSKQIVKNFADWQAFSTEVRRSVASELSPKALLEIDSILETAALDDRFPAAVMQGYIDTQVKQLALSLDQAETLLHRLVDRLGEVEKSQLAIPLESMRTLLYLTGSEASTGEQAAISPPNRSLFRRPGRGTGRVSTRGN